MARRRKGRPVHGWVILDKPTGMVSTRAVSWVRRLFDAQKAGHAGTLDPLATGVLPIALGEATKTVSFVMDGEKSYRFTIKWGEERTTDDAEGEVTETSGHRPSPDAVAACLPRFVGETMQTPPAFSAIKVDGERSYDLARAGGTVELSPRPIWIDALALVDAPDPDHAVIEAHCGKGVYMRSLARDIARSLETRGHVSALRRTRVGPFTQDDSISLESLEALGHIARAPEALLPVESGLDGIPAMALSEAEASRLRCGQPVSLLKRADLMRHLDLDSQGQREDGLICAMTEGKPVAITRLDTGQLHPVRVLNL